jgi:hypothetical protein
LTSLDRAADPPPDRSPTADRVANGKVIDFASLDLSQSGTRNFCHVACMKPYVFRCPNTGLEVQGWASVTEPDDAREKFEAVECLACGRLHMVNPRTGKTLGVHRAYSDRAASRPSVSETHH